MECTPVYILPPGIAWVMVIAPLVLIVLGALKLKGGVGWDADSAIHNLEPMLQNGGYLPEGSRIELVDHDGNRIPLTTKGGSS